MGTNPRRHGNSLDLALGERQFLSRAACSTAAAAVGTQSRSARVHASQLEGLAGLANAGCHPTLIARFAHHTSTSIQSQLASVCVTGAVEINLSAITSYTTGSKVATSGDDTA
eukprot:SAG31_NODE_1342_length_8700_cov_12.667829_9_plen_113_part_00